MACLHKALLEKRYKYITLNLDWGENPNQRDEDGRTLLMKLVILERDTKWMVTTAKRLLKLPKAKDHVDKDGRDILMHCILNNKIKMAKHILYEPDFDITKVDKCGYSALHYASEMGVLPTTTILCQLMYRYGLNIDSTTPTGMTPLMLACRRGFLDCARALLNEGNASLSMRDDVAFKGPREWLEDVYIVCDGIDPFAEGVVLQRKDSFANESKRPCQPVLTGTPRRRTQSTNSILRRVKMSKDGKTIVSHRVSTTEDGCSSFSVVAPLKHPVRSKRRPRYPRNPTIIFEDSTGKVYNPLPEMDSVSLDEGCESYTPVLYKFFTVSSIQITPSFRPPACKPKTPSPEPEPEPEPEPTVPTTDEEEEPPEKTKPQSARSKLKKALKFKKAESLLESLKRGQKKENANDQQKNVRSINVNQLMANIKKKQAKSRATSPTSEAASHIEKSKEKFALKCKHLKPEPVSSSEESNHSGTSVDN